MKSSFVAYYSLLFLKFVPSDDCSPSYFIAIKSFTLWINIIYCPLPNEHMGYSQYLLLKWRLLWFPCISSLYVLWFSREPKEWGFWLWSHSAIGNNLAVLTMNTLTSACIPGYSIPTLRTGIIIFYCCS